jgi:hypothetical protein
MASKRAAKPSHRPQAKRPAGRPAPKAKPKVAPKPSHAKKPAAKPARAPPRPAMKPPAKTAAAKEPTPELQVLLPGGRRHVLSLSFVRDGDEFLARLETDGGHITELKNRSLDQLLTLVAGELEDLLA